MALVLNILLIFGILAGLGAVLTLPGIAGIVLTIGISVDANVLIFERIREELNKGKGQIKAVSDGFNNALSSILSSNNGDPIVMYDRFADRWFLSGFGSGNSLSFAVS